MFLVQPEVSELLVLEVMVSDQGAPRQSSGGAASCFVLPAVGDESLHGSKTKHLHFRNSASHNDLQNSTCSKQQRPGETIKEQRSSNHLVTPESSKAKKALTSLCRPKTLATKLLTVILLSNS